MAAIGSSQAARYRMLDHSGEKKAITLPIREVTALTIAAVLGQLSDLEDALDAVLLGTRSENSLQLNTVVSNDRPANKNAQVETEMLVTYKDVTTDQPFSFRLTTVNYAIFNYADPPAGDVVIIAGAGATSETTTLVAALEAVMRSPSDDSHSILITGMRIVR